MIECNRSQNYGWTNTYVFTKAMGEMLISELKENIPVVIIRPTIVSSTYKEPFPGWVEGVRYVYYISNNFIIYSNFGQKYLFN